MALGVCWQAMTVPRDTQPPDSLRPDWPAPARVQALCTTRQGGVSRAPFDSFNLGSHVGDDAQAVQRNWQILQQRLGAKPLALQQVHGTHLLRLTPTTTANQQADACTTAEAGLACTVMVADCLPVLLCNRSATQVAAAHAGWRGLAHGVLEQTVAGFAPGDALLAWLGPCIGPQAFEVGDEVRAAFCQVDASAQQCFTPGLQAGKWWADLAGLARQRLHAAGVSAIYGNDGSAQWCTAKQQSRFFSHRRDAVVLGSTGRMAACIWLRD